MTEDTAPVDLATLNTPEPVADIIRRLRAEADAGRPCQVTIADALEFRREAYGLSRYEFASVLGMGANRYGEILAGRRVISKNIMRRAYAIGVPAAALLQPDVWRPTT